VQAHETDPDVIVSCDKPIKSAKR